MVFLPLTEIASRSVFGGGIPGAISFTQHLTLWVGFLGAALAAKEGKLLALATGELIPEGRFRDFARGASSTVAAGVSALLFWAAVSMVRLDREAGLELVEGFPVWVAQLALPIGFGLIALRLVGKSGTGLARRLPAVFGLAAGCWIGLRPEVLEFRPAWPALVLILAASLLGGPLFVAIGGAAAFLFLSQGISVAAVPAETYRLVVSPTLPAIPLFTLAGFLLAEGKSSLRLLRVFRGLFGWIPGGTAVVCAVVCAFFTAFTGGSGVTILALGGLLATALKEDGYREEFSLGLLTSSGSLGLLFPPALPLILYGIVASIPIEDLFIGGLVPGILLVLLLVAWGIREGKRGGSRSVPFSGKEAVAALWHGKWELLLPVVVLVTLFKGWATPVEASAVGAFYAFLLQTVVHRDLPLRAVPQVLRRCTVLVGGVLIILGVAMGLTNYLVDAEVPSRIVDWAQGHISSPLVFLLCLNIFLLVVGCLMDIFSATVVVVPLIVPLGLAFGIHPVHLAIIFVANLELGYLTPPVGLNLFLASYRFEKPLMTIYRSTLPMLIILGVGVLLITYFPALTLTLLGWLGRG